jgi:hypothetical protein
LPLICPQNCRMSINIIARLRTINNKKPAISNGFYTSLDCVGFSGYAWDRNRTGMVGNHRGILSRNQAKIKRNREVSEFAGMCVTAGVFTFPASWDLFARSWVFVSETGTN